MSVSPEQLAEWKEQVASNNMTDVLNAMLAIAESGDPQAGRLLEIAGQNVSGVAKSIKLQLPGGPLTFEEFRQKQLAKLGGNTAPAGLTTAEREVEDRVERFKLFAVRAPATFLVDDALELCRKLVEARNQDPAAAPEEIYRKVKGWESIRRAEDGDPTGAFGGHFAYSMQGTDDPECRALFSRVERGRRVELADNLYDMRRVRAFWMREVRPQQFAFYRTDLFDRFTCLPDDGWTVGPI